VRNTNKLRNRDGISARVSGGPSARPRGTVGRPVAHTDEGRGYPTRQIELEDEPASEVTGIVDAYRQVLNGQHSAEWLNKRLDRVTDANGQAQGVGLGSLQVRRELNRKAMKKPTAR